ncbi:hypothetical protein WICPIJ_000874 [Wickerhamomyces pijperi]|uniref:Major facilitator superfamily (MFS) profile domain-containing protein n=1 Tax=Wickerhamomyces pijperi TaxID=599730 RepID=A0A9P8QBW8_WICPI|nr:hypothetical protein WICPIJ_000874 [Wickerhamomyces pijperi]
MTNSVLPLDHDRTQLTQSQDETSPLLNCSIKPTSCLKGNTKYSLSLILPALWIGSFLSALDGTIVATTLTAISEDFHEESLKSWIATSYLLTNCSFQPLYGKISDIIGRKYPLLFSQACFGIGLLLSFLTPKGWFWGFVVSRGISGIGGGGLSALSSIIVSDIVSLEERGLFQGYANLNYAVGQLIGAPLGAWVIKYFGWRWLFFCQIPFVSLAMWLTYNNVNIDLPGASETDKVKRLKERVDFKGSFCIVVCITAFLLTLSLTNISTGLSTVLKVIVVVSFYCFVYVEKYVADEQILPLHLLQGTVGVCGGLSFVSSFILFSLLYQAPSYVQIVQDQSIQTSANYLIASVVSASIGSLLSGVILKRCKGDIRTTGLWITFFSMVLITAACLCMCLIVSFVKVYDETESYSYPLIFGSAMLGLGSGLSLVAVLVVIVAIVGKEGQATATGMNYLFRSTAQVLGAGVSLSLFSTNLNKTLWDVLKDQENGRFIYEKLLEDAALLKDYIKDQDLVLKVVDCYRTAFGFSLYPCYFLAVVGFVLSLWLSLKGIRN